MPLTPLCNICAEALFCIFSFIIFIVNKLEINNIIEVYLEMWGRNQLQNFVPLSTFINEFQFTCIPMISLFFPRGEVYYDKFLQFVFVIVFFNYAQLISLLLSMCKIHSNLFITSNQINQFTALFDKSIVQSLDLSAFYLNDQSTTHKYINILF